MKDMYGTGSGSSRRNAFSSRSPVIDNHAHQIYKMTIPDKKEYCLNKSTFSSDQMIEIREMYRVLKKEIIEKINRHQEELLLVLQNVSLTSFNPFFENPKNEHPFNKSSYSSRYLSVTCIYVHQSSEEPLEIKTETTMYPFGYYRLKDEISEHKLVFKACPLRKDVHQEQKFKDVEGIFKKSEDGYWVIIFDTSELQAMEQTLKLDFEGVLI